MYTELIRTVQVFDFHDLDTVFNLIVKPAHGALDRLRLKKHPDSLDIFFIKLIELFVCGVERAEEANELDHAHIARLMAIDVHKLRLLALQDENYDQDAVDFALNFVNEIVNEFPADGRFWFQHAIIQHTFKTSKYCSKPQLTTSFTPLNSLSRAVLSVCFPVSAAEISKLIQKRICPDFSNTLLTLILKDFDDFVEKDIQAWSFVKYFQTFTVNSETFFPRSELSALFLFVCAFYRISNNSFHFKIFLESFLSAQNTSIAQFWPFAVYALLRLTAGQYFEPSDTLWFKIFQLLKEEINIITSPNALGYSKNEELANDSYDGYDYDQDLKGETGQVSSHLGFSNLMFHSHFQGTILQCPKCSDLDLLLDYDFNEDFSIERDTIVNQIADLFDTHTGPFKQFLTLRSDRTLRLGSYFCGDEEKTEKLEESLEGAHKREHNSKGIFYCLLSLLLIFLDNKKDLDDSIEFLREKLANLSNQVQTQLKSEDPSIDYFQSLFVVDTNVLLSGSSVLRTEITNRPDQFIIPLIVLAEINRLRAFSDKTVYAQNAWEFLQNGPLDQLKVFNSYGRMLRRCEITQQLAVLSLTRTQIVNDDQIIELANQFHSIFPGLKKPILLTEDVNMRLKGKSRGVRAISMKEFRDLCNC